MAKGKSKPKKNAKKKKGFNQSSYTKMHKKVFNVADMPTMGAMGK